MVGPGVSNVRLETSAPSEAVFLDLVLAEQSFVQRALDVAAGQIGGGGWEQGEGSGGKQEDAYAVARHGSDAGEKGDEEPRRNEYGDRSATSSTASLLRASKKDGHPQVLTITPRRPFEVGRRQARHLSCAPAAVRSFSPAV
ncbi:hypothetical protein, partial [Streptomyces sp. NPDC001100]